MNDKFINPNTIQKQKSRENETPDHRETRLAKQRERNRQKRAAETIEERDARHTYDRERKRQKLADEADQRHKKCQEYRRKLRSHVQLQQEAEPQQPQQDRSQRNRAIEPQQPQQDRAQMDRNQGRSSENPSGLSKIEQGLLRKFRTKVDNFKHSLCPTCNESFPSIVLVMGECRRCYSEKTSPKKFSKENNMDPGEVSEELKELTEIEEMLIARVFPVMSVYKLRGGQHGYRGNVINFPQDVQEFATHLPRNPSALDVLIVRRQSNNPEAFRDFNVRRGKVARALCWLKENNNYYADIIIDNEILNSLPINGSVDDRLQNTQTVVEDEDHEDEDDVVVRTFVPLLPPVHREDVAIQNTLDRVQNENRPIEWPQINNNPINEFQTPGYIACAFPTLYPTGCADLRAERIRDVKPAEYFRHLLLYKDGRFARHARWRYFALNSQMRWRALQEGKVYVKQNLSDAQISVEDIQEMITQGDSHIADRIMQFGEGLRGSRQFWNARRLELSDMIKQIGSEGLVFFTFSAADLHWPDLHKLMPSSEEREIGSAECNHQNIIDNPHIAVWFFSKRFEIFFNDVVKQQWDLEDYWYRFEWQHRGSVHVHGIGKRRNAPVIELKKMQEDENVMNEVVQYLDSQVTTINPGLNAPAPDQHLCKKRKDEIHDDQQDYIELVNKLQRHTRCSPSYCLRVKDGQQSCRFGYPKEIVENTFVRDDGRGQPELVTKRNDPLINPHNRLQLQGWRSNVDYKPVMSTHAALRYIAKYASKAEPRSAAFSEILDRILCDSKGDDPFLASAQKLLLNSVAERDISAQETCHLLLGLPLYHSSRTFVSLNLNIEAPRWIRGTGESEGLLMTDSGRTEQSPLKRYWDRPIEFEDFTLYQLHLTHKFVKGNWKKCQENVVRVYPRPSSLREGPQWEEFCRVKVLLHVRHRDLQQLTEGGTIGWSTLYSYYLEEIDSDPMDLLGPPIDNEETEIVDEEDELLEDDEQNEFRPDWMVLAEMGPNAAINCSSDLGSRDMDRNHDWNEARQRYSNTDLMNADAFVSKASSNGQENSEEERDTVDYQTLNENQRIIFKRIESHYNNMLAGYQVEPLRIIVMGTAGTGKTYLIKAIRGRLREIAGIGSKSPVLVIAPTGVAAFNIDGTTIHSTLSIPINTKNLDINGERLKLLQERFQNVRYIIIDEKSMVGRRMLGLIDMRLRQAFPEHSNEPFGGISVIMLGDFGQLLPVLDLPVYTKISRDPLSNNGLAAYNLFKEVYKLDVIQRQSGNSPEQQTFRELLLQLRDGESTLIDWKTLTTRFEGNLSRIERDLFSDATFLLTKWEDVNVINTEQLKSLNVPVAKILAVHTGGNKAKKADSDVAHGLEAQLLLSRGARIMLTANLWTVAGLVNGAMGTVQDILFEEGQGPPCLPIVVLISFDSYKGPTITNLEGTRVVPIAPVRRTWEGNSGKLCSRLQVPVRLAWAITVHKSQGLTLQKAVIDIGNKEFTAGLSFVAVSRIRELGDIIFKTFNFERLQRIKECKRLGERKNEEERLVSMIPKN